MDKFFDCYGDTFIEIVGGLIVIVTLANALHVGGIVHSIITNFVGSIG